MSVRRTSSTEAKAVTMSDTGETTARSLPSASRQAVFMESESLPTGIASPAAWQKRLLSLIHI